MEKAKFMAFETKRRGAYTTVGRANMSVQLLLLDMTVKSTLLSNTETWCEITKKEEDMITSYHHEILCIIFGQPRSTPYYGIIGETGIWPYKYVVVYKKLMFLHHLIHSSDDRIAKMVVLKQQQMMMEEKKNNTWFAELYHRVAPMKIDIKIEVVEKKKKSSWKKELKKKLGEEIEREIQELAKQKTKLRFLKEKPFEREDYVETCHAEMVGKIMSIRLNMVDCRANYKNNSADVKCVVCDEIETTEHLLECQYYETILGTINMAKGDRKMNSTEWLIKAARRMDFIQEIRKQHISV